MHAAVRDTDRDDGNLMFVRSLAILLTDVLRHNRSSAEVGRAVDLAYRNLEFLLETMPLLALNLRDDGLFVGNRPVPETSTEVTALKAWLCDIGLAGISLARGISRDDFTKFAVLLASPVAEIQQYGGIDALLAAVTIGHVNVRRAGPRRPSAAKLAADRRRILIIDDDQVLSQALAAGLTSHGYLVNAENDSRRALDAVREFKPHLVILDMCMPNLDGGDVAQQLNEHPDSGRIPIVFLTSIVQPDEADRMVQTGQVFMSKPVALSALAKQIESCLGG